MFPVCVLFLGHTATGLDVVDAPPELRRRGRNNQTQAAGDTCSHLTLAVQLGLYLIVR